MSRIALAGRTTADAPPGTVAFLIGMRVNRPARLRHWLPVAAAMPRMLRELARHPELGLLSARTYVSGRAVLTVQYRRSAEDLDRYARARDAAHLPAWREFNRRTRDNCDVPRRRRSWGAGVGVPDSVGPRHGPGPAAAPRSSRP
ncbi:DUF4188 domain-containing protein [Blastococcus sp. TML/M2B]|uniref:monooxygenase family protein n=1 Tax=unclassified Blastococcus TaxID=2619396 RepID=UPI00190961FE|nr:MULTISPECIES: DUF4188 domain-containing protein [unclassified Blastococcus]MBN1093229.1 DUF4188 domain-containing protein [Blastococcus sp. TML/M2B]MBN1096660.1 DUF4188 domain-containing protein [Blastococcus sp. TML/C7B]